MTSSLEQLFDNALKQRIFSGASLLVRSPEEILIRKIWGSTRFAGGKPVDFDTRFDLASLTKALVTASLYIRAVSEGTIELEDTLSRFMPVSLIPSEKRDITIRHLLGHCSGFPAYRPFYMKLIEVAHRERRPTLLQWILDVPLADRPGRACTYSDIGFILLGMILEMAMEAPLDELALNMLFRPLGIQDLEYRRLEVPGDPRLSPLRVKQGGRNFAATELCPWRERLMEGEVHDENAYCLDCVAGHSGLFGTADGIYHWLGFLWKIYRGLYKHPSWNSSIVQAFWKKQNMVSECTWALGFDIPSRIQSSAGERISRHSIGHLGFTGTSFWVDLENEVAVILLTNRVHPSRENNGLKSFRPLLHDLVMEILNDLRCK